MFFCVFPKLALGAAAALAAISLSPGSAQAFVVTVGGLTYDVTTFTGAANNNSSKFATAANGGVMPWYNSSSLASQFATAVGPNLGLPNQVIVSNFGPYFGYQMRSSNVVNAPSFLTGSGVVPTDVPNLDFSVTWAKASPAAPAPVPGHLPLFGAAAAYGFSRKLRKRIKLSPAALGSALPQA